MKKKRILVLNYEFPPLGGGGSYVSFEIAENLVKKGHNVDVVTMGFKGLLEFEKIGGINIHRVKCLRKKKESCQPWEQLTYIISAKKFLRKHLKENKYNVCHCHFIIPTGFLALWLKRKYNLKYIVTSHGSDVLGYNKRFKLIYPFLDGIWEKIVTQAKVVTSPSRFLLKRIHELAPNSNIVVIPNGIEKNKFQPMRKERSILVVARLFRNKGVQEILDGLKGLDLGNWRVLIVGDGPYREFLEKKCVENNLERKVEFLGWIDNKTEYLKELYGKASIFISASWFESFGLTVLEALQAECYVLASDNAGYKELNLGNEHYFKIGKPKDLRKKLEVVLKKKKIQGEKFDTKYEWGNVIKKYEEVL